MRFHKELNALATADDPVAAAQRVEGAIGLLLAGVQSLVEQGAAMPNMFAEIDQPEGDTEA